MSGLVKGVAAIHPAFIEDRGPFTGTRQSYSVVEGAGSTD